MILNHILKMLTMIGCIFYCNCNHTNNFNLKISLNGNKPFYQLKYRGNTYTGTNIDTLKQYLRKIKGNAEDCYRNTDSEKCFEHRIIFNCLNSLRIDTFYNQMEILYCVEGNALFNIVNGKKIIRASIPDLRGVRNEATEKEKLLILCNTSKVTILIGRDTIFTGNYNEMIKNFVYDANKITERYRNIYPIAILKPTCNLTFKRIFQISNCFKSSDKMLFFFGKCF